MCVSPRALRRIFAERSRTDPKVFEEFRTFLDKYGDLSVVPTRFFLGKPKVGEEMQSTRAFAQFRLY